jgi:hypothetical protein
VGHRISLKEMTWQVAALMETLDALALQKRKESPIHSQRRKNRRRWGKNGRGINEEDMERGSRRKTIEESPEKGQRLVSGANGVREKSRGNVEKVPDQSKKISNSLKSMGHVLGLVESRAKKMKWGLCLEFWLKE